MNYRRIATFTGWLWIITFVTSILARFFFYAPVLNHKGSYVTGAGRHWPSQDQGLDSAALDLRI